MTLKFKVKCFTIFSRNVAANDKIINLPSGIRYAFTHIKIRRARLDNCTYPEFRFQHRAMRRDVSNDEKCF